MANHREIFSDYILARNSAVFGGDSLLNIFKLCSNTKSGYVYHIRTFIFSLFSDLCHRGNVKSVIFLVFLEHFKLEASVQPHAILEQLYIFDGHFVAEPR